MTDILRMDHINSLPQPFVAKMVDGSEYDVGIICVQTGCVKIDVCGRAQNTHIGAIRSFIDADGFEHDMETFFVDYVEDPKGSSEDDR